MMGLPKLIGPDSILFSSGDKHKLMRKMYMEAFHPDALENHMKNFDDLIQNHLWTMCAKGSVRLHEEMKRLTCETMTRVMMGINIEEQQLQELIGISEAFLEGIFALPCAIPGSAYDKVHTIIYICIFKLSSSKEIAN